MKEDSLPLLGPGRHVFTLEELRKLCVHDINSIQRHNLFAALHTLVTRLTRLEVACELWVDGSYLTEKFEPEDIDLCVVVHHAIYENLSSEAKLLLDDVANPECKYLGCLDAYVCVDYPADHPFRAIDPVEEYAEQWSIEHNERHLKGFARVKVGHHVH